MKLFCSVVVFHLLFFLFLPQSPVSKPDKKKLEISYHLAAPTIKQMAAPAHEPKTAHTPKIENPPKNPPKITKVVPKPHKKDSPKQKATPVKNLATKKMQSVKKPSQISPDPQIARNKEIAAIRSQLNEAKKELFIELPKGTKSLELASDMVEANAFVAILILFLQENLHMPYADQIAVTLTLAPQGKYLSSTITRCKNQENKCYLEKRLPELTYPNFPSKKNQSFSLLFDVD